MSEEDYVDITPDGELPSKYKCDFGCGNAVEFVMTMLEDNTTQKLCIPCFVGVATDIIVAMTEPDNPAVTQAVESYAEREEEPVGTRGRNAIKTDGVNAMPDFSMFEPYEPDVEDAPEAA
jgi:hypothetical protein